MPIASSSDPLHERIDHLLLPRLVEIDGELVAVDMSDMAITEFLVEHARADFESRALGGTCRNERAVDGDGLPRALLLAPARTIALRPLPARRLIETGGEQVLGRVEAARSIAAQSLVFRHLDVTDRQLVDETRRQRLLPGPVVSAVLREGDLGQLPCPGQPNMRQPPLLLEPGAARFLEAPLMGDQAFVPAAEKHQAQ